MKTFFVSSEVEPYAKTGGLGDVSSGLPAALSALGLDVTVVMPLYPVVKLEGLEKLPEVLEVQPGNRRRAFGVYRGETPAGVSILFLENPEFFGRHGLYGDERGDFHDNALRFGLFCAAVAQLAQAQKVDLIHCNDWQCGLLPYYAAKRGIKSLITIHNLAFHGQFPMDFAAELGLPLEDLGDFTEWGRLNFLKNGILRAAGITTVSEGYAEEILTPEFGCGLDGVLRSRSQVLRGIVNGADTATWNPLTDERLPARFSARDLAGKARCRAALHDAFGLPQTPDPIIGMVGRLTEQKGMDLVLSGIDQICSMGFKLALLGAGQAEYENAWRGLATMYPGLVGVKIAFSETLAHLVEAGSDMFLMPSRFEPCGLNQMYSQSYGTPPVVHAVGGLRDTVTDPLEPGEPTGFKFTPYTTEAMLGALGRARDTFRRPEDWKKLVLTGMRRDFSWTLSAKKYEAFYKTIL
jgi:starch synthase